MACLPFLPVDIADPQAKPNIIRIIERSWAMSQSSNNDHSASSAVKRAESVFCQKDLWYFRTREGKEIGPFRYQSEAQSNLDRFLADLKAKLQLEIPAE